MKTKEWRKQTKTKRSSLLISMFLLCILTFSLRIPSKAATPGVTKLNRNKTYTGYDLDSNGKKERLLYKENAIYVNGRKVYSLNGYETDCRLLTLRNGKRFLYVFAGEDGSPYSSYKILRYRSGKMYVAADLSGLMKNYHNSSVIMWAGNTGVWVADNTVRVFISEMNWTVGSKVFAIEYTYSNGTLKRKGYGGNIIGKNEYLYTAKAFSTYKTPGSKTKAFTLKSGAKVSVTGYYLKNNVLYLKLKNVQGKSGWIKALTRRQSGPGRSPLVWNAYYAG